MAGMAGGGDNVHDVHDVHNLLQGNDLADKSRWGNVHQRSRRSLFAGGQGTPGGRRKQKKTRAYRRGTEVAEKNPSREQKKSQVSSIGESRGAGFAFELRKAGFERGKKSSGGMVSAKGFVGFGGRGSSTAVSVWRPGLALAKGWGGLNHRDAGSA